MTTAAWFHCFAGIAGDMALGSLLDAGADEREVVHLVERLPVGGWKLETEATMRNGIAATGLTVHAEESGIVRTHGHIAGLIEEARLPDRVRDRALATFRALAEAEGRLHRRPPDQVHFHEVGGIDAIVDIAGASIGLALLGIDHVYCGPPRLGRGFVWSQHGLIPVPAPATAELLARAKAPVAGADPGREPVEAELLTPTGAAILTTIAEFRRPDFVPTAIGYGFGSKELPWPNALRVWLGETDDAGGDGELLLETNIDDMNPQFFEPLLERLFAAGALDVWLTPITMKKGRPATTVSVLAAVDRRGAIEEVLIANSTTLGIRASVVDRVKAPRRVEQVATRWGEVRVKLRGWQGRVISVAPEYDDCLALARAAEVPIQEVWNDAHRISERFVGQRWPEAGNVD